MPHQMSDRELINAVSQAAYDTGQDSVEWLGQGKQTALHRAHILVRTTFENEAVDRLIKRDEKIKLLQATVKDLKRQLMECGETPDAR
jgi:parvulin-like peptidyl-prolyl isomerase